MMVLLLLGFVVPVLLSGIFYRAVVVPPRVWGEGTSGGLLAEARIRSKEDALDFADKAVREAFGLWAEPSSNWQIMHNSSFSNNNSSSSSSSSNTLVVEARRITRGPYSASGILLGRSRGEVVGADPDEVYNFFASPDGMKLLDESMDVEMAAKYIKRYDWREGEGSGGGRDGTRLDVHESFNPMPWIVADRYHVVLNGYRTGDRFFLCKSIVHDSRPGSSVYFTDDGGGAPAAKAMPDDDGRVRAVTTFYFHISPLFNESDKTIGSIIRMINFADFQMGSTLMNWLICRGFFPGVYRRIVDRFGS